VAVTAGRPRPHWTILLRPRWLAWHLFAVVATLGMLWLGDWQLHRAESGNELSWAYTFEWPLFAIFGVYFWAKTLRDELRSQEDGGAHPAARMTGDAARAQAKAVTDPAAPMAADTAVSGTTTTADDDYVERLRTEVRRHGKWHGLR
jgi:DNA-binding transcriptional regulator of glucitol operon